MAPTLSWTFVLASAFVLQAQLPEVADDRLSRSQASVFARLALKCVHLEYPNKLDHVINDASEVQSPRALHPVFYGCFDWHSSVHGHWLLVRILRTYPDLAEANDIRTALDRNLSAENVLAETAYLDRPNRQSFERTYGWAWLLKLAEELHSWDDVQARRWGQKLRPLADALVTRYLDFFPKQTYAIRTGVHPNTAFGLAFALDYARATGHARLESLILERSRTYYLKDKDYPSSWEPGGEDFFSPALMEADLMRRVLSPPDFHRWFRRFLPRIAEGGHASLLRPAVVTDRTDPKLVHLDGLNLSRAWCMRNIASALPPGDEARRVLTAASADHAMAGLEHVASGDYAGEHWLGTFAVFLLSSAPPAR